MGIIIEYEWCDIHIDLEVCTPKGHSAIIYKVDKTEDKIYVRLKKGTTEIYSIKEISRNESGYKPSLSMVIGSFIIKFARIEHRLRNSYSRLFNLTNEKAELLFSVDTAGTLLSKVNKMVCSTVTEQPIKVEWQKLFKELERLVILRNDIVHGYMYESASSKEVLFSNPKRKENESHIPIEELKIELENLNSVEFDILFFFDEHHDKMYNKLNGEL